jgi:predicted outer membrane repeat protein
VWVLEADAAVTAGTSFVNNSCGGGGSGGALFVSSVVSALTVADATFAK